jgi:hypothetical protein
MQHPLRRALPSLLGLPLLLLTTVAVASETSAEATTPTPEPARYRPSLEMNVVQPFLGITDAKVLLPIVRTTSPTLRGELMLGTYTDYAWGPISRPVNDYGKVWLVGVRPGYREYLAYGFFVDASLVLGLRHEEHDVHDDSTLNGFYGRLWANAGWQWDITDRFFTNVRGGAGLIVFRTDKYGSSEKTWQPAGDVDVGVRF